MQTALVQLVEHNEANTFQGRVSLEPLGEETLCDHLHACALTYPTVVAGGYPHGLADTFTQQGRHPASRSTGGNTTRLKDQDAVGTSTLMKPRLI
jgi:hypothetical protein